MGKVSEKGSGPNRRGVLGLVYFYGNVKGRWS